MAHFRENPSERSARGPWNRTKLSVRFRLAGSGCPCRLPQYALQLRTPGHEPIDLSLSLSLSRTVSWECLKKVYFVRRKQRVKGRGKKRRKTTLRVINVKVVFLLLWPLPIHPSLSTLPRVKQFCCCLVDYQSRPHCLAKQAKVKKRRSSSPRSLCHFVTRGQQGFRQNLLERPSSLRHRNWPNRKWNRKSIFCLQNKLSVRTCSRVLWPCPAKTLTRTFPKIEPDSVCKTSLISKESGMAQTCQTHSDQGKTFQKQKKKKRGQLAICECTHIQKKKKKKFVRHFRLFRGELGRGVDFSKFSFWITTKPKPFKHPDNFFSKQKFEHNLSRLGAKPREWQVCPCNTYNQSIVGLRFKTATPTKWRRERRVGAWAIHGIWWIFFFSRLARPDPNNTSAHCGRCKWSIGQGRRVLLNIFIPKEETAVSPKS